jgi:hypothetical protein
MITRQQVETALDFFILLESMPGEYSTLKAYNKEAADQHNAIVRQFAEEMQPCTLEHMQDVFYSFTNSPKYRQTMAACSVARTVLSSNWHRVGEWVD